MVLVKLLYLVIKYKSDSWALGEIEQPAKDQPILLLDV